MSQSLRIQVLQSFDEMVKMLPLIQQLNPNMTESRYTHLLQSMVQQGNYFQVACFQAEKCLGLTGVWIGTQLWCGKFIEVDNFIVDASARGQGVGKLLLNWIEERARKEQCEMIRLDTYVTLEKAQRFYFRNGFKIEGFHMTKKLKS